MTVRLGFPTFIFERNLLDQEKYGNAAVSEEYLSTLKNEIDAWRQRDPKGRQISNRYTGWQSNDGVEKHPAFAKIIRCIETALREEVQQFFRVHPDDAQIKIDNTWANVNDKGAWNTPHLHNGCWYSGVFYIYGDGDEGDLQLINTDSKVVADHPSVDRNAESLGYQPVKGRLVLFPSGAMHMVEPNPTNKERYSISFNSRVHHISSRTDRRPSQDEGVCPNEFTFELDALGNPIIN
mgnify:FL=1|jgi:uncharacterized protein (TIGR02466 family)